MAFTNNYHITIEHPETGDEVDARVTFSYYKGYAGSLYEPPEAEEVELVSCYVDGRDITHLFSTADFERLESMLMCAERDDGGYDYDDNFIDEGNFVNYN